MLEPARNIVSAWGRWWGAFVRRASGGRTLKARGAGVALLALLLSALVLAPAAWADEGYATWYGEPFHGRRMANGEVFDMHDSTTTASNQFPFGTWLRVTNPQNGHAVEVQVRDRGAFRHALDLSYAAFAQLAPPGVSRLWVHYEVIPGPGQEPAPAPLALPQPPAPAEPPAAAGPAPNPGSYTVQPGDTLASIGRRFRLRGLDIAAWNGLLDPNLLRPAQVLRLTQPPAPAAQVYVVQEGDVLWGIAERLGVSSDALAAANSVGPDDILRVGQRLATPTSPVYHVVEPGETLAAVAQRYGTSVEALAELNGLARPDHLLVGQRLRVR